MAQQNISKMHAIVATEFVGSPLTFYLMFYAVRSAFGNRHRLSELFDGHRRWYRLVALCTFAAWAVFLGVSIGRNHKHFAQSNCEWRMEIMKAVYFLPVALVIALAEVHPTIALVIALPPLIVAVSWSTAIFLRRKTLWYPNGVRRWPTFFEVWSVCGMPVARSWADWVRQDARGEQVPVHPLHVRLHLPFHHLDHHHRDDPLGIERQEVERQLRPGESCISPCPWSAL
jgi:hypothetical protein